MKLSDRRFTLPSTLATIKGMYGIGAFDLDPCADTLSQCAPNCLFEEGLSRSWFGHVYVNPPFSDIRPWIEKAMMERPRCKSITLLLPANRTDQHWFETLWEWADELQQLHRFLWLRPRVKFGTPEDPTGVRKNNHPPFACFALNLIGGAK